MVSHVELFASRAFVTSLTEEQAGFFEIAVKNPDVISACLEQVNFNRPGTQIERSELELTALFAVDYALGRMTSSVSYVADFVRDNWDSFGVDTKNTIKERIEKAINNQRMGSQSDHNIWEALLEIPAASELKV